MEALEGKQRSKQFQAKIYQLLKFNFLVFKGLPIGTNHKRVYSGYDAHLPSWMFIVAAIWSFVVVFPFEVLILNPFEIYPTLPMTSCVFVLYCFSTLEILNLFTVYLPTTVSSLRDISISCPQPPFFTKKVTKSSIYQIFNSSIFLNALGISFCKWTLNRFIVKLLKAASPASVNIFFLNMHVF